MDDNTLGDRYRTWLKLHARQRWHKLQTIIDGITTARQAFSWTLYQWTQETKKSRETIIPMSIISFSWVVYSGTNKGCLLPLCYANTLRRPKQYQVFLTPFPLSIIIFETACSIALIPLVKQPSTHLVQDPTIKFWMWWFQSTLYLIFQACPHCT